MKKLIFILLVAIGFFSIAPSSEAFSLRQFFSKRARRMADLKAIRKIGRNAEVEPGYRGFFSDRRALRKANLTKDQRELLHWAANENPHKIFWGSYDPEYNFEKGLFVGSNVEFFNEIGGFPSIFFEEVGHAFDEIYDPIVRGYTERFGRTRPHKEFYKSPMLYYIEAKAKSRATMNSRQATISMTYGYTTSVEVNAIGHELKWAGIETTDQLMAHIDYRLTPQEVLRARKVAKRFVEEGGIYDPGVVRLNFNKTYQLPPKVAVENMYREAAIDDLMDLLE